MAMIKKYPAFSFVFMLCLFAYNPVNAQVRLIRDISYVAGSNLDEQKLDIYVPAGSKIKNLPVHIYVHGGAWNFGDKSTMINARKAKAYTDSGIILVSINYRLSPEFTHPAHIEDCATAVKWVTQNIAKYGGNPRNVVISGHSAGAHLVALLGTHSDYLKAEGLRRDMFRAIIPVDTATYDLTHNQVGPLKRFIQKKRNNAFGRELEILIDGSPISQIRKGASYSPFIIFVTAERDDAIEQSKLFESTLKKKSHRAKTVIVDKGYSHRDMNMAIFDAKSVIFKTISRAVKWP